MKYLIFSSTLYFLATSSIYSAENCEIHLDKKLFDGTAAQLKIYKDILTAKGYSVVDEMKKDSFVVRPSLNAGCFEGIIMGYSCSVMLELVQYKGDTAKSGLKISNPYNAHYDIDNLEYKSYSLFSKPKLEDMLAITLKEKLSTCEVAKTKKDSFKTEESDFITDLNSLESVCDKNEALDINTYNYYAAQLEKYKEPRSPYADSSLGSNSLKRFRNSFSRCPSFKNKIKAANSIDDTGRAAKTVAIDADSDAVSTSPTISAPK